MGDVNYWLRKIRIPGMWIILLAAILSVKEELYWPGIGLAFLGLLIRLWASGHINKDGTLTVSGPYAYTRNPLYLGSFFMGLGFCWALLNYYLLVAVIILYTAIYYPTIAAEEEKLLKKFGKEFEVYRQNVPKLIPHRLLPKQVNDKRFTWDRVLKNHEWRAVLAFLLLCFVLNFSKDVLHPYFNQKASMGALVKEYLHIYP